MKIIVMRVFAMKKMILLFLMISLIFSISGCVYSNNYDENGNEMSEEQVKETIYDIKDDIESQIDSAISEQNSTEATDQEDYLWKDLKKFINKVLLMWWRSGLKQEQECGGFYTAD